MKVSTPQSALAAWLLFAAYTVVVIRGAIMPPSEFPSFLAFLTHVNDKVIHAIEYFLLFWIAWNAFRQTSWQKYAASSALIYSSGIGIMTEILQIWAPSRAAGWGDFAADVLGAGSAFLMLSFWRKK